MVSSRFDWILVSTFGMISERTPSPILIADCPDYQDRPYEHGRPEQFAMNQKRTSPFDDNDFVTTQIVGLDSHTTSNFHIATAQVPTTSLQRAVKLIFASSMTSDLVRCDCHCMFSFAQTLGVLY